MFLTICLLILTSKRVWLKVPLWLGISLICVLSLVFVQGWSLKSFSLISVGAQIRFLFIHPAVNLHSNYREFVILRLLYCFVKVYEN